MFPTDIPPEIQDQLLAEALAEAEEQFESEKKQAKLQQHLDQRVRIAYKDAYEAALKAGDDDAAATSAAWDAFDEAVRQAGNPADQIDNYMKAGIVLQPKQLLFAAAARRADEPEISPDEIGQGGSRGPGKSFSVFAQLSADDCQRFPGLKALYLRKVGLNAKEQLNDLINNVLGFIEHHVVKAPVMMVEFPNGSAITVGHFKNDSDAEKYQGLEYDVIVIEEATQLTYVAFSALHLSGRSSKIHPVTGKRWRARTYNTTNPLGIGHQWYKKRFVDPEKRGIPFDERDHKTLFIGATVDDNNFIAQDYVDRLDGLAGIQYKAFRQGDWEVSAGAYFATFSTDHHVFPNERIPDIIKLDDDFRVWVSMDYGLRHWNIVHLHAAQGERIFTLYELAHRFRSPALIAPELNAVLAKFEFSKTHLDCFLAGSDVFRNVDQDSLNVAQKWAEFGYSVAQAITSAGSRVAGAHEITKLLGNPFVEDDPEMQPRWFIHKRCTMLIEQLAYMEPDPNHPEDVRKMNIDDNGEGGDDAFECARYGLYRPHVGSMA